MPDVYAYWDWKCPSIEYGLLTEQMVLSLPTDPIMTDESHHSTIQFSTGVLTLVQLLWEARGRRWLRLEQIFGPSLVMVPFI